MDVLMASTDIIAKVHNFISQRHGQKLNYGSHEKDLIKLIESLLAGKTTKVVTKTVIEKVTDEKAVKAANRKERDRCKSLANYYIRSSDPNSPQSIIARQIFDDIDQGRIITGIRR